MPTAERSFCEAVKHSLDPSGDEPGIRKGDGLYPEIGKGSFTVGR